MPFIWNKRVLDYKVDIFESNTLNYDRSVRLKLADPEQTVSIQFPSAAPADFVDIGASFSTVKVDAHKFDELYHLLQTESPIFFTAYESGSVKFAGLTTDPEGTGEGFKDPNA